MGELHERYPATKDLEVEVNRYVRDKLQKARSAVFKRKVGSIISGCAIPAYV